MPALPDRRPWLRPPVIVAVALVALVASAALAVLGAIKLSHSSTRDDERAAALHAGGQLAVDFSSVDYRHLSQFCAANARHATATFAGNCGKEVSALQTLFGKSKVPAVVSTSTVQGTALQSFTAAKATVLVALEETLHGGSTASATANQPQDIRVRVDLVKQHGDWLVNGLTQV